MDKKALLAVMISLGIWIGWQKIYLEPYQKNAIALQQEQEAARRASLREENKAIIDAIGIAPKSVMEKKVNKSAGIIANKIAPATGIIETSSYQLLLTNGPNFIHGWKLKDYYNSLEDKNDSITLSLVSGFNEQIRLRIPEEKFNNFNEGNWSDFSKSGANTYSAKMYNIGIQAERTLEANNDGYFADIKYKLKFSESPPAYVFIDLFGSPQRANDKEGSIFGQAPDKVHLTYRDANTRDTYMGANLTEPHESSAGVKWMGIDTRYFVMAILPSKELRIDSGIQIKKEFYEGNEVVRGSLVVPTKGNKEVSIPLRVYFGPKHLENLEKADPILSDAIDFGWTSAIAIPLLKALKWFYKYLGNYGLAIIVLTFFIKVLLSPLMYKSMKSTAKMSKLQPQLNALREKYKDDKEKLNTEMMQFMKTNGYNPVGGCLPMLLQMPIFFALYRVFFNSIELYQAPFFGWIHDLSTPDPYFITPVMLAALMYFQQKLSPITVTDPAQQKMMQFMPVMFGVFMLLLPSGLNIYMLVNSITTIGQQHYLNKKFGIGKFAAKTDSANA